MSTIEMYYRLVDADDVEGLVALFTADCVYERPGYPPIVGTEALRRFYTSDRVIRSGKHVLETVLVQSVDAAVQGSFSGQLKNGAAAEVRFADFFHLTGELIDFRRTYFYAPSV